MKKTGAVLLLFISVLTLIYASAVNSTSYFERYQGKHEVYLESNSSNARIVEVEKEEIKKYIYKTGEAIFIENCNLDIENLLKDFSAEIVFAEHTEQGVSYFAYSKKIKGEKRIKGERINLHLHQSEVGVKMGTPLIYGSF